MATSYFLILQYNKFEKQNLTNKLLANYNTHQNNSLISSWSLTQIFADKIVRNSWFEGAWGAEERGGPMLFHKDKESVLYINRQHTLQNYFDRAVDRKQ